MKKFLALVLALVMTMSLVTISAGAEFTDADKVNYDEAVEVMTALKVVDGLTDGSFNPQGGLSRGAAAKIICNMMLGVEVASSLEATTAPFSDVPADHVFAGYIAYCVEEGIVDGYADGTFKPAAPLNGYAFLKMLLGALGYDGSVEGFTGTNWAVNVAKLAKQRGLVDGNESYVGSKAATREEAMLYAFNTMLSKVVKYEGASNSTITIGDIVIKNNGTASYTYDGVKYFYEANFEDLKLADAKNVAVDTNGKMKFEANSTDDWGRASYFWYVNDDGANGYNEDKDTLVGEYAVSADNVVVVTKTGKTLAYWLETLNKEFEVPADASKVVVNGDSTALPLGLGDEIEVYLNADGDAVDSVIVNKVALAEIVKVSAVEAKDYDYSVKVGTRTYKDTDLPGFDAATMVKDTYVLVNYAGSTTATVLNIEVAPYVEGVMTAQGDGYIKIDGVKYEVAGSVPTSYENTYKFFMDKNGYVLNYELVEEKDTNDGFVYLLEQDTQAKSGTGLGIDNKDAKVLVKVAFMDGTVETLNYVIKKVTASAGVEGKVWDTDAYVDGTIAKDAYYVEICGVKYEVEDDMSTALVVNTFYTYTKTDAGIVLKALDDETNFEVTATVAKNSTAVSGSYYANSATKLVAFDGEDEGKVVEYVGYKNFPESGYSTVDSLVVVDKDSNLVKVVYAKVDALAADNVTYAYATGNYETDTKGDTYYEFYVDGKVQNYVTDSTPTEGVVYTLTYDAANEEYDLGSAGAVAGIVAELDDAFFMTSNDATSYKYADEYTVWDVTGDTVVEGEIVEGDSILFVSSGSPSKVKSIFVVDSFIDAQPETITELRATAGDLDWEDVITLGLTQTVDISTIYLAGEVTTIDAENYDDYADALFAFCNAGSPVADFAEWVATLPVGYGVDADDTVGFVNIVINGESCTYVVKEVDGEVVFCFNGETTDTDTFGGVKVTVDSTGLYF